MLTLTIDGKRVAVPPGSTVRQAAQLAGIEIPTLCHIDGLEPIASCFLCAVQIQGRRSFLPSCALLAEDGMTVITSSPEVRDFRRLTLELLLSDHAGDCIAPCARSCPAGLDIPGFLHALSNNGTDEAFEVITRRLAFPSVLGRICPRLCEQHCRRQDHDQSLSIGALHRFAADHHNHSRLALPPARGTPVAIIGAGPAGLTAAFHLLQFGHRVTIFDAHHHPGGMLRYAIPTYRLPRAALDSEIAAIQGPGADLRMGAQWGRDFTLSELREAHPAVFIAIGAQRTQSLRCPGEELALPALDFLGQVARGCPPDLGDDVVVVGGGNTAIDCARTAIRLGARRVRIVYRRTMHEMPCLLAEAEAAIAEGVEMEFLTAPLSLHRNNGGPLTLACHRMKLGPPDASGRPRPVPVEGSDVTFACSTVIAAIGQSVDLALPAAQGLAVTAWGIAVSPATLETNLPGVFAGGDAVLGADLAVRAVAAGRLAAISIHQLLEGRDVTGEPSPAFVQLTPMDDAERAALFRNIESAARSPQPRIDDALRVSTFDEVELGLPSEAATHEARRCLQCGCSAADTCRLRALASEYQANPARFAGARRRYSRDASHPYVLYEPGKCILCQACVRIAVAEAEPLGLAVLGRGFDTTIAAPFGFTISDALTTAAQRCAEACPTGALSLRSEPACPFAETLCLSASPAK